MVLIGHVAVDDAMLSQKARVQRMASGGLNLSFYRDPRLVEVPANVEKDQVESRLVDLASRSVRMEPLTEFHSWRAVWVWPVGSVPVQPTKHYFGVK